MQTLRIRPGEYSTREDVIVDIVEEVVEEKKTAITEGNILKTIESLENKKKAFCAGVDAEIATNIEMLARIRDVNKDAILSEPITPEAQ